jgi:hypothetical protein
MPLVPDPGQLFEVLGGRADGSGGRLCLSRFLAIVLLASLMGLSARGPREATRPGLHSG